MSDGLLHHDSVRARSVHGALRSVRAIRRATLRRWQPAAHSRSGIVAPRMTRRTLTALASYACALLGVALITALIGLLLAWHLRITNISMLYLLPVLALATIFGRGPAVLASLLAALAFDFFFVPPFHQLTVNDPIEWLSLTMLLVTALVTGHLTATLRTRAREARQQERSTATLYGLARLIASGLELDGLLQEMAERVVVVFAPAGVQGCAIALPGTDDAVVVRAVASRSGEIAAALRSALDSRNHLVAETLRRGVGTSMSVPRHQPGEAAPLIMCYTPLRGAGRTLGVLASAGTAAVSALVAPDRQGAGGADHSDPLVTLFAAICGQIALAIEHAELEQAAVHAAALHESDRLKDVLLGSVTHDLRTPLAAIKAITTSLLQPDARLSDSERQELIESIDQSVDRLNRLVSNLLDLSRLEAGVAAPQRDWHLIGDIIATVLDRLDLAGQTRGRRIEVDLPPDLPLVFVDHEQIEQVLTNLVENAVKYSPVACPIRVAARARSDPDELEVAVADSGVGIPAAEREAIFDKFYRAQHAQPSPTPHRPPAGTGLGLAICKAIVQAHGGRIWATSAVGGGAVLTFTLPIPGDSPHGELPEVAPAPADASDTLLRRGELGGEAQQTTEIAP
jgi:two-component system sensor histidine kinase KdpD